ncbi:MAG: LSU ribosomal protein L4p (L1e), partial [uncultured Solirubrobacteraceae bacterium]
ADHDAVSQDRRRGRHGGAARRAVRGPGQRGRDAPGGERAALRPAPRHPRHQDPRHGPRRRRQAVPPEGHRPRSTGHASRSALRGRWRRVRPAPAQVRAPLSQADAPARAARRPQLQVHRRCRARGRGPRHGRHQDAGAARLPHRAPGDRPRADHRALTRRAAGALGAEPADGRDHPRRLAEHRGHPPRRRAAPHAPRARRGDGGVLV